MFCRWSLRCVWLRIKAVMVGVFGRSTIGQVNKAFEADRVSLSVMSLAWLGFPFTEGQERPFFPVNLFRIFGLYVFMVLLFSLWDNLLLVFLTERRFSTLAHRILTFHRFTGRHPGCRLGLQRSHGSIQDPVSDAGLVSLLDNSSRYVHSWHLPAPSQISTLNFTITPSPAHHANTWCLLATECRALHHAPLVSKGGHHSSNRVAVRRLAVTAWKSTHFTQADRFTGRLCRYASKWLEAALYSFSSCVK